jgi:LysM repeat protein
MDRELTTMTGPRVLEATPDRRHTLGRWLAAGACAAVLAACGGGGKKHAATATTTAARTTIPTVTTTTVAPVNYKVVRGDTLGKIARKFGVSISAITDANKITDPDKIVEGQVLVIPAASSTTTTRAGQSSGPSTSRGAVPGTTSTTKR